MPSGEESWYARLFAKAYDPVMAQLEQAMLQELRRSLLAHARGRVLEIGAGTGANFPYYPPSAQVLATEPSAAMYKRAARTLPPSVSLLQAGVHSPVLSRQVPEGGFDTIVSTLVLCTVPDVARALADLYSWLAPSGQLLLLEHIHDRRQPQRSLQQWLSPIWRKAAAGCHLNRQTDMLVREAGFSPLEEEVHLTKWVPFYYGVYEKSRP
ncbi:class I SAM-dependent methyltransferase [Phaeodactylibacter luteus]|uniref:Class I SAM-dependent methyltransferase n=1 Tax=Phaeodactylibacter luteus TaxID=1564516 RepID=A0A5C6RJS5_9BACT|nr:class I SAM-dependent methyltransferase [Phaeodactylibacter luteus]TXB62467.1 class I SAM-dependent methyltransferase [Phaeodactylibacter luteus]